MSSCSTSRNDDLLNKKTCPLAQEEKCVLVGQGGVSSSLNMKTCLLVQQVDISSRRARRHVLLPNNKTCLLVKQETCLLVKQEDICLLVEGGAEFCLYGMSSIMLAGLKHSADREAHL